MADINSMKTFFKEADNAEALAGYQWATGAMEVRGLVEIPGMRRKRSDAGQPRNGSQPTVEAVRERIEQPSLGGLPDEDQNR